ncbi:YbdD/YjiX family protein [Glycomyces terrestris]|uniref:YbdD/YjiX family protein n=1 Tax=Glycomyces terrestris TaxID=2493553 RepID=A0A426UT13_9ACTN|nr:YbdD/YjiX family protein [Glycomyces terrestris]RRR96816.1 YbdD/YjiX family protein [Glycomyces terrestris]
MSPRRLLGLVRWYLRELTGESAYDRYLERHRLAHPGAPALPRREFERMRTDRADAHPRTRCC